MKAKKTSAPKAISTQEKQLDAQAVPTDPPQVQLPKETVQVNLDEFYELARLKYFLDSALSPDPDATTLEDESYHAYKKIDALLTCWGLKDDGLHAQGSELIESVDEYMQDAVITEVQKMRLAAEVLYRIHRAEEGKSVANGLSNAQRS